MQRGSVFFNGVMAGIIMRSDAGTYIFEYDPLYSTDPGLPAISLTMPKAQIRYESAELFPFFYGLLSEGINKDIQCRLLKIDANDDFTRLLKTASVDTIGAVTVKEE